MQIYEFSLDLKHHFHLAVSHPSPRLPESRVSPFSGVATLIRPEDFVRKVGAMRRNELFHEVNTGIGVLVSIDWSAQGRASIQVQITNGSEGLWVFEMEVAADDRPTDASPAGLRMQHPVIPDEVNTETTRIPKKALGVSLRRTVNCFEVVIRKSGGIFATFCAGFVPGLGKEIDKLNVVQCGAWSVIMEVDEFEQEGRK